MKVMVTGAKGQLGHDVCKHLNVLGIENKGVDIEDFDLTCYAQVMTAIENYHPTCVIHCAAYTAVEKAENNIDTCRKVNVDGTQYIAEACAKVNASMAYISTDYVFSGNGDTPFEVDDPIAPQSVYGLTKYQGELAVQSQLTKYYIVRTSWVFGAKGSNFVKTMLRLGKEKELLMVVNDQIGSPTYTIDLAILLCDMIQTEHYGVFHATSSGYCSWYDFSKEIMRLANLSCNILPVSTAEYGANVKRPLNSRMSKRSLQDAGFSLLPTWQDGLQRCLDEIASSEC